VENVSVHPRVNRRHLDVTDDDVLVAWQNCLRSAPRLSSASTEHIAVGFDTAGNLLELVAVRTSGGDWVVYHAMRPPTKKTLKELGLIDDRR
jgi:hypothetical protein